MKTAYIQTLTSEKAALLYDENQLEYITVERPQQNNLVGNIYLARVRNMDKSLQAAFVDYGEKKHGFLPNQEIPGKRGRIEQKVHEGQTLWVQVVKEPYEEKGARLTANVTLPGRRIIYMPYGGYVGVSKKISDRDQSHLRKTVKSWCEEGEGAIVRTSARSASNDELKQEFLHLKLMWKAIEKKRTSTKVPSCVFENWEIPDRFLRKMGEAADKIIVDDINTAQYIKKNFPDLNARVKWEDRFEQLLPHSISQIIAQMTRKNIRLSSGAEIIFEKTRAFTIIDVNTASFAGNMNRDETILSVNLEAAEEIMKQLRLRNISGIILIDFIDMEKEGHRNLLLKQMKQLCQQDIVFAEVHGFTRLGILEMSRKREGLDAYSLFLSNQDEPLTWSFETYAYQLERELIQYRHNDQDAVMIEIHPDCYEVFLNLIDMNRLTGLLNFHVYVQKNDLLEKPYALKYTGDELWLKKHYSNVDKL